jgi:hypothetical protein
MRPFQDSFLAKQDKETASAKHFSSSVTTKGAAIHPLSHHGLIKGRKDAASKTGGEYETDYKI